MQQHSPGTTLPLDVAESLATIWSEILLADLQRHPLAEAAPLVVDTDAAAEAPARRSKTLVASLTGSRYGALKEEHTP